MHGCKGRTVGIENMSGVNIQGETRPLPHVRFGLAFRLQRPQP